LDVVHLHGCMIIRTWRFVIPIRFRFVPILFRPDGLTTEPNAGLPFSGRPSAANKRMEGRRSKMANRHSAARPQSGNEYVAQKSGNIGYIFDGQAFKWQQKWQQGGNRPATRGWGKA
jgi:hypothetical protein